MNTTKQFWALFKFHMTINPFIWFMVLALASPLLFTNAFSNSYHPNLSSLLTVQNLFFVGILGIWTLAPEMTQRWGSNTSWNMGTEFILTRAIDRPVLYRSRAAYFYLLIFLIPVISLLYSLQYPDLKVTEYSQTAQQQCLRYVPGSTLEPNPSGSRSPLISIPWGNTLVEEWHFWMFTTSALCVQLLFLLLYPLKYRLWIFYALFFSCIFIPLWIDLHHIGTQTTPYLEHLFFFFTAHQPLFWILTAAAFILTQLWCEWRFARLEQ